VYIKASDVLLALYKGNHVGLARAFEDAVRQIEEAAIKK